MPESEPEPEPEPEPAPALQAAASRAAAALAAELVQLEAAEKEQLEKNLSFLEDTERSRLEEEDRILEKSNNWRERHRSVEELNAGNAAAAAMAAADAEPVALRRPTSQPSSPGSPGGWMIADGTRHAAATEALLVGLAAEQQREWPPLLACLQSRYLTCCNAARQRYASDPRRVDHSVSIDCALQV